MTNFSLEGGDVTADTLGGFHIVESTLGEVPSATLGGEGSGGTVQDTCDPAGTGFATCATLSVTVPPGPSAKALVLGRVSAFAEQGDIRGAAYAASAPARWG